MNAERMSTFRVLSPPESGLRNEWRGEKRWRKGRGREARGLVHDGQSNGFSSVNPLLVVGSLAPSERGGREERWGDMSD